MGRRKKADEPVRVWNREEYFDKYKDWKVIRTGLSKPIRIFNRGHVYEQVEKWSKLSATFYRDNILPIEIWRAERAEKIDDILDMILCVICWFFAIIVLFQLKAHVHIPKSF